MTKKDKSAPTDKVKLILLIGIPLLLVLSLALVFGRKPYQEEEQLPPIEEEQEEVVLEQYPVEPKEKARALEKSVGEFKRTKRTIARGIDQKTGKPWQVTIIGNPNDPNWQMYQPKNVSATIDKEKMTATVSWIDSDTLIKPHAWLVGYWSRIFNPIESCQIDRVQEDRKIRWVSIGGIMPEVSSRQKSVTLDSLNLSKLPQPVNTLYFVIYIRTKSPEGQLIDYIYGGNNSSETPFSQNLTE